MGHPRKEIDIDELRRFVSYDPETGVLRWVGAWHRSRVGTIAGTVDAQGYVRVGIGGRSYLAHRVSWALFYGEQPPPVLDHINRVRTDNRIENLRAVTHTQSVLNRETRPPRSGFRGVKRQPSGLFVAEIRNGGPKEYLGSFETAEQAFEVYCRASREKRGEFSNV